MSIRLAEDAARRQVLGGDVAIDITAMDETNTRIRTKDLLALLARHDGFGMVGLIGVQSNQFPRALDLARPLCKAGVQVVIGGFHVSGCLAMLPEMQADLKAALDLGCTLFAGEAEGRMDGLLQDAAARTLKPIYNHLNDLPALESAPMPYLPSRTVGRTVGHYASFDAGRGCPYRVLVLHHHQRAGTQVALPLTRRRRATDPPSTGPTVSCGSSSPMTISPATRTGSASSTA